MAAGDEPTLGEIMRRLDEVARQMTVLAAQMTRDREAAAATYVPRELYNARHDHVNMRIDALRGDVRNLEEEADARERTAAETRRQFMFLVLSIAIPAVGGLLLSMFLLVARGGMP